MYIKEGNRFRETTKKIKYNWKKKEMKEDINSRREIKKRIQEKEKK